MPNLLNSFGRSNACVDNSGYVVLNLSGAQKFDDNTVFPPGKYKVEIAPGIGAKYSDTMLNLSVGICNMEYIENIPTNFIIRAYCGGSATNYYTPGINPYNGIYKINGVDARNITSTPINGIDSNSIFGAGGGNSYTINGSEIWKTGGGGNCLGDGNISRYLSSSSAVRAAGGAGSCLHFLPVGGTFGTDYIRAYHVAGESGDSAPGSALGGGGCTGGSRGGNTLYGSGATSYSDQNTGIGGANKQIYISSTGYTMYSLAGAYYNGSLWIDAPGKVQLKKDGVYAPHSYIRITCLGPVE